MKTYKTGQTAPYGTYATAYPPDIRFIGADGETLEGLAKANYVRLPTPLVFVLSPVIGGIFVLAFPVLVLACAGMAAWMLTSAAVRTANTAVVDRVKAAVDRHAYVVRQRWEPVTAYLDKAGDDKEEAPTDEERETEDLEREVTERRDAERNEDEEVAS